jgi:transposase-like protein
LATARLALDSGANVTRAAELAGFASDTQLRRAWRQFGAEGSPSRRRLGPRA